MIHWLQFIETKKKKKCMNKYATNIRERWVTLKRIIHDYNY